MSARLSPGLLAALFIVLLTLLIAGPFWQVSGLPAGTPDEQLHSHRSAAVTRAFEQGVYWPRWFPTVYNGLGAPTFHHYSPALYWLVGAIHGAGVRLDQALKLVMSAALILSGFGIYGWLRFAFSPAASLVGAALYLLHPHTLTRTFYFVGDYPQILALLLMPVCLWALTALHMQARPRNWLAAVGALAALALTHNLTAMTGAAVLALYWLLLAIGYRRVDGLARCALAALAAALVAAAFWLPSLADLTFVQIDNARQEFFHFSNHFLSWPDLFTVQSLVLDSRAGTPLKPPVTFGAATWLALLAGLVSVPIAARRAGRYWGLGGGLLALLLLSLTLNATELLWEHVPGLSFVQFPSRFLSIAPFGALPAAALAVDVWPARRRWLPAVLLLMVCALVLSPYLFPTHTPFTPPRQMAGSTAADIRRSELEGGAWGMTGSNEFLVKGADMNVIAGLSPEPAAASVLWRSPHEAVVDLSGQSEPILLRLHYHPGWSAGTRAALTPGAAGWMQVTELRDPSQPLVIRWEGTVWQRRGERLSLLGLFATALGLLFFAFPRRASRRTQAVEGGDSDPLSTNSAVLAASAMIACLLALIAVRYAVDRSSNGPFLVHSPAGQLAFPVQGEPVVLGNSGGPQVTFLGWEMVRGSSPRPGDPIIVRLYWQPHGTIDERVSGFMHLYTPAIKHSWATGNRGVGRPDSQWWHPEKYYVDELRLIAPLELPPMTYSLIAGMVASSGERLTVPGSGVDNILYLRELEVKPTRPGSFQNIRPGVPAPADTKDNLRLQGYDLWPSPEGQTLRLFWETSDAPANDWITYIHLHDPVGELVAQFDGAALAGLVGTSKWHTNALYIDRRQLNLPTGLDEGSYLFRIGLYNITSGERLPFQPDRNSDNFEDGQLLVPLKVLPSEADVSSCYVCIEETVDRRTRSSFGVRNLLSVSFYNPVLTFARQQSARFCRSPRACRICRQPEWAVSICRLRFLHMPTLQHLRDALPRYLHLISASEERRITQHDIQQEPLIGVRRVTETVPVCKLKIDRRQVDRRPRSLGQGFQ